MWFLSFSFFFTSNDWLMKRKISNANRIRIIENGLVSDARLRIRGDWPLKKMSSKFSNYPLSLCWVGFSSVILWKIWQLQNIQSIFIARAQTSISVKCEWWLIIRFVISVKVENFQIFYASFIQMFVVGAKNIRLDLKCLFSFLLWSWHDFNCFFLSNVHSELFSKVTHSQRDIWIFHAFVFFEF